MRRILLLTTLLLGLSLSAQELIKTGSLHVTLASPKAVTTIPMGNYLGSYNYPLAHRYTISAYVDGFIAEVNTKPYAAVKKGQKLFVLKSPTLLDLQSNYINTLLELEFYAKELKRLKPLSEKGVVASKRYIEAKNRYDKFKSEADFKANLLKAYGMTSRQLRSIRQQHKANPTLVLLAPADATISELDLQVGSFIHQGDVLAKLVDTSECHFEVDLPWSATKNLNPGDKLRSDDEVFTVFAVSPDIDAVSQTRGVDLHSEEGCAARGGASMNVTLYKHQEAWEVPASAVVGIGNRQAIFVAKEGGFSLQYVEVLAQIHGKNYISATLNDGDKIAISSVLALKSAAEGAEE